MRTSQRNCLCNNSDIRYVFTILAVILCYIPLYSMAAEFNPFEGPKPIAIFIQSDPWLNVIGSDTPRVAIYENGEAIFLKTVKDALVYHHIMLTKDALAQVKKQLKPVLGIKGIKSYYDIAPSVTDQPVAMFFLRGEKREVTTSVYGLMAEGTDLPAYTVSASGPKPIVPPDELLKLHKWFCGLDYSQSEEWTPKYVEVMMWDYSYAPEASIQWPKEWPSLNSSRAIKRNNSYSIFLDSTLLPKLRELLASPKEKGAVMIDGKKMSASYRFTFPSEPIWRKAFISATEKESARSSQ